MTSVGQRFSDFLGNIALTDEQKIAGASRRESVVAKLNAKYYGNSNKTVNSKYVGSWGKYTRIGPPRDVDVLYELPSEVYQRFEKRSGNKQSQLLQEIKEHLAPSYPNTAIRGDGPIVLVPFTSYNVEIVPAFKLTTGQYWICMTDGGGHYKTAAYDAEIEQIATSERANGNVRDLIRMMKCWQAFCSVSIKSFWIELLAVEFLNAWPYAGGTSVYYDWMVRDFLLYMKGKKNGCVYALGTCEANELRR